MGDINVQFKGKTVSDRLQGAKDKLNDSINKGIDAEYQSDAKTKADLAKAKGDLGKAGQNAGDAYGDALQADADLVSAGIDGATGIAHSLASGALSYAAIGGLVKEEVGNALAFVLRNVGKALGGVASYQDGKAFTLTEIKGDPNAQTWSEKMFAKSGDQADQVLASFSSMIDGVCAAVAGGASNMADLGMAAGYTAAAAGRTLEAAEQNGVTTGIEYATAAKELAYEATSAARAGNAKSADLLRAAAGKLVEAQNAVNTAQKSDFTPAPPANGLPY